MAMDPDDAMETLRQRRDYLAGRVALKRSVGWEWQYDERERSALAWALDRLARITPVSGVLPSSVTRTCRRGRRSGSCATQPSSNSTEQPETFSEDDEDE